MREDVKKFLFMGPAEDKASFFKQAQTQGLIHFIDPHLSDKKEIPEDVQRISEAIRILRRVPPVEQEENYSHLNDDSLVAAILRLHEQNEQLLEELRVLAIEKSRIEVFGNFSFEDIAYIEKKGRCKIQFFCARSNLFVIEPQSENLIYIASEHELDYYMAVNDHPVHYEKMIEMKFESSLGELKKNEKMALAKQRLTDHELREYCKYFEFLHHALVEKANHYHLYHAQTYIQQAMGGSLFAVEGWVPINKIDQIHMIIDKLSVYAEEIAIEATDAIPTYLENHGLSRVGEDLVHIYDTPSAIDKDPSIWVLGGFALFFAMIIGDAGYGLIYLMLALFLRYKYPDMKGTAKRVWKLFMVLCVGCIIWGTLTTSFFGMQIDPHNPVRKLSLVQKLVEKKAIYYLKTDDEIVKGWVKKHPELEGVKDVHQLLNFTPKSGHGPVIFHRLADHIMFELALFIGVVHLILSLFRYVRRNWQNSGWIVFLIGAYLYFPFYLKTPSLLNYVGGIDLVKGGTIGFELMLVGIGVAWVLSIIRHGWTGIFEITVLIQVFADTLSYLRLYALGLAGAIVASTVNEIASGLPFMVGGLLVVFSHFINILLGTMSGIIHGLRLNFLEWYHYSFEGGGKQFQPLKLLKRE